MAKYFIFSFLKDSFPVSQFYGDNVDYYAQFNLQHGHEGVDLATPNGTEIYSPLDGIIVRDGLNDKDYGNFLVIWDPVQKCAVWFCHLQDVLVNPTETVRAGQLVGHTNNTGNTRGAHVHVNFVETDENAIRLNMDNGEQGFLNLLDKTLVEVKPFPGLQASDPQTPIPDVNVDGTPYIPNQPEAQPQQPATPAAQGGTQVDPATFDKLVTNSNVADAVCDFLGIPRNSSQELVISTLTQQKADDAKKVSDMSTKYTTDLANYQVMQAAGYDTLDAIDNKVGQLQKDNEGLQKQVLEVSKENANYLEQLKAKNEQDATAIEMGIEAQKKVQDLTATIQSIAGAHGAKPTLTSILAAIDKLKSAYDEVKKNLQKKTVKEDVQIAQQVAANLITSSTLENKLSALDSFAALFFPTKT